MGGTGPGGGASFFGGFAKGFGQSMLEARQRKHAEELEQEAKEYKVLQDALHYASANDRDAVPHILKKMEEFAVAGQGKRGKKKAQARQGILSKFADALEGGKQTPESQQAMQQNQQMIQQGTPEQAERPRRALTQPMFQSSQQLAQQETDIEIEKRKRLLPYEIEKVEKTQKAEETRQLHVEAARQKGRETLAREKEKALVERDQNKLATALYNEGQGSITQEGAFALAGDMIAQRYKAQTQDIENRHKDRVAALDERKKEFARHAQHWSELEKRAREASARGDKSLSLRIQKVSSGANGVPAIRASIQVDEKELDKITTEINAREKRAADPLTVAAARTNPAMKKQLEDNANAIADLNRQYEAALSRMREKQAKLDAIATSVEENRLRGGTAPSTGGGEGKTLRPSNRKYKVIRNKEDGKKYKFYGYKPDGSPDMEEIPEIPEIPEQ